MWLRIQPPGAFKEPDNQVIGELKKWSVLRQDMKVCVLQVYRHKPILYAFLYQHLEQEPVQGLIQNSNRTIRFSTYGPARAGAIPTGGGVLDLWNIRIHHSHPTAEGSEGGKSL